jgi:hypothetical protein
MPVHLREEPAPPDEAAIVVHLGAGRPTDVIAAAIRNHDEYVGITSGHGLFTVSLFAAIRGVAEADILEALPQRRYALAEYRALRAEFEVLPTTIEVPGMPEALRRLQRVHYDAVLLRDASSEGLGAPVSELDDAAIQALEARLSEPARRLLGLFGPRREKPRTRG